MAYMFKIGDKVSLQKKKKAKGTIVGFTKKNHFAIVNWENGKETGLNDGNFSEQRLCYWVPVDNNKICKNKIKKLKEKERNNRY